MKAVTKSWIALLIVVSVMLCLGSCGADTSGLGTLDIGAAEGSADDTGELAPLGGSDTEDTDPVSDQTPAPEAEPDSEPTPAPDSDSDSESEFVVEEYSCDCFDCYIPEGWTVTYQTVDAGAGTTRIYVFVQDPTDSNNILFFVSGMEPCFTSSTDKEIMISSLGSAGSVYEWAPVLNELSAAGLLEQWASVYTLMDVTGFSDGVKFFRNYGLVSVLSSTIADNASADETRSQVIAEVSIPGASQTYGMLYDNDFVRMDYPYANADFYVTYSNRGFVLSADRFSAEAEGMAYCVCSFDFTKFNSKYGSSAGITADANEVVNPELTLPDSGSFFQ